MWLPSASWLKSPPSRPNPPFRHFCAARTCMSASSLRCRVRSTHVHGERVRARALVQVIGGRGCLVEYSKLERATFRRMAAKRLPVSTNSLQRPLTPEAPRHTRLKDVQCSDVGGLRTCSK